MKNLTLMITATNLYQLFQRSQVIKISLFYNKAFIFPSYIRLIYIFTGFGDMEKDALTVKEESKADYTVSHIIQIKLIYTDK